MPNNITYGSFQFPEISNCGLLYLCRFVCVVEKWGRQLNTGFIEEAVQWEAYMAYYPVAQKSAIMRIRSLIVMIWFCAKASLMSEDKLKNFIKQYETAAASEKFLIKSSLVVRQNLYLQLLVSVNSAGNRPLQ